MDGYRSALRFLWPGILVVPTSLAMKSLPRRWSRRQSASRCTRSLLDTVHNLSIGVTSCLPLLRPRASMNAICPFCSGSQEFPDSSMDCMVNCQKCQREFLLSKQPRDSIPLRPIISPTVRSTIKAIFVLLFLLGSIFIIALAWAFRWY